jgi:hypothetical protein
VRVTTRHDTVAAGAIDEQFVPRPNRTVSSVALDGELVLAAARPGLSGYDAHWLDRIASVVWSSFDSVTPLASIIDDCTDVFGADRDAVRDDVLALARTLGRAGLLDGVTYEPPAAAAPARAESAPIGTPVPPYAFPDLDGRTVTNDTMRGSPHVLVNWSARCGFCNRIAPELKELVPDLQAAGIEVVFLGSGSVADNAHVCDGAAPGARVLLRDGFVLFDGLGTPAAYAVDADGNTASDLALGAGEVPALLRRLLEQT